MMLLRLKSYLIAHDSVSLEELSAYLNEDPSVVQDMLEHFIRKGYVIKETPSGPCDKCPMGCSGGLEQLTIYQWQKSQKGALKDE